MLTRPVQLAVRAVLIALLAVAGAWACVAHCALLGSPHHSHGESNHQLAMHAHDEHMDGAHVASVPAVDGETASGSTSGAHCPPAPTVSALTIIVRLDASWRLGRDDQDRAAGQRDRDPVAGR
ncbi:MAG TPA: hypothetical protein VLA19_31610 [Herpetosiphonaceae bacterium]|nr:hypothetical protein [Herpetosiphonaceae bacterium]